MSPQNPNHWLPGFRSNTTWKKAIAIIIYCILFLIMFLNFIFSLSYCETFLDFVLILIQKVILFFLIVAIFLTTCFDTFHLQDKIKGFQNHKVPFKILSCWIALLICAFIMGCMSALIDKGLSAAYHSRYIPIGETSATATASSTPIPTFTPTPIVTPISPNSISLRAFHKELKSHLKDSQLEKSVAFINKHEESSLHEDAVEQVDTYVLEMLRENKETFSQRINFTTLTDLDHKLQPLHQLKDSTKYSSTEILNLLDKIIANHTTVSSLENELGDLSSTDSYIPIADIVTLDVYVHYKIENTSELVNHVDDLLDTSKNVYYFTAYDDTYDVPLPDNSFEGAIEPVETEFTQNGVYLLYGIENGSMEVKDTKGFERNILVYKELSSRQVENAYNYEDTQPQRDQLNALQSQINQDLQSISKFLQ